MRPRDADVEQLRALLEEERRAGPAGNGAHEVGGVAVHGARAQRVEPAAPHRLEDPEPQLVGEPDLRQVVALGQVVEREEVDGGEVAQDVDDRAARVGVANRAGPRVVDLDALEETAVDPPEERVGLVRGERAVAARAVAVTRVTPARLHLPGKTRCAIEATFFDESGVTPVCG